MLRIVLLLGVVCLLLQNGYTIATSTNRNAETNRGGVPGTGYGCDMECGGADVNYVLKATVAEWYIHGSERIPGKSGDFVYENGGATYRTRTWEDGGSTSPLCTLDATGRPWSGTKGNVGPCLQAKPGQSMAIKIINNMKEATKRLHDTIPTAQTYMVDSDLKLPNIPHDGRPVTLATDFTIDKENMPHNYDLLNLHLHGLQVETHLFYPQGTSKPDAPWISLDVGECYCYRFRLPTTHPTGTYYYHPHRHGATGMQTWNGMWGPFLVTGGLDDDLADMTKNNTPHIDQPFFMWDAHVRRAKNQTEWEGRRGSGDGSTLLETDDFLRNQAGQAEHIFVMVNNEFQPTLSMNTSQVMRIRLLCGASENMCGFRLRHTQTKEIVPLYNVGSDGSTWASAYTKQYMILMASQREEILIQIAEAGLYEFVQSGLSTAQWYGTGPHDQVLAYLEVVPNPEPNGHEFVLSTDMEFAKNERGSNEADITDVEIMGQRRIDFAMNTDVRILPFEQYVIDNKSYNVNRIDQTAQRLQVEEWVITNSQPTVHPLHIHVNPFQVKEVRTALENQIEFTDYITNASTPMNRWRDTAIVPPYGSLRIWTRYAARAYGKTVFHCHFEAHSDTGMMSNLMITRHDTDETSGADESTRT